MPRVARLEAGARLDQKLQLLQVRDGVDRKGQVDVQRVAEGRARADDAQAHAAIAQPARIELVDNLNSGLFSFGLPRSKMSRFRTRISPMPAAAASTAPSWAGLGQARAGLVLLWPLWGLWRLWPLWPLRLVWSLCLVRPVRPRTRPPLKPT